MPLLQALKPSKQDKVKLSLYTIQWNLSIVDTTGTQLAALYREVPLIQRYVDLYTVLCGWDCSVLIREVSLIQR